MGLLDRFVERDPRTDVSPDHATIQRRVKSILDHELATWIDNAVVSCGRNVTHGLRAEREEEQFAMLAEAEMDAEALLAMVKEIRARRGI